jgi:nucleotide-binding universal stress UspA family protein
VSAAGRAPEDLYPVVGYDGSVPARRALDAAVRLMRGRTGRVEVVYVAHVPTAGMVSSTALAEIEVNFDDVERALRTEVGDRLRGNDAGWEFIRRDGPIGEQLIAVAKNIRGTRANESVVIVVGSSSSAMHRVVGSVAVTLARHSPVPLVIVP